MKRPTLQLSAQWRRLQVLVPSKHPWHRWSFLCLRQNVSVKPFAKPPLSRRFTCQRIQWTKLDAVRHFCCRKPTIRLLDLARR